MDINKINEFLQNELKKQELWEVKATIAAYWLEHAGLLEDTDQRQGKPLRDLLRAGKIKKAIQRNATYWFIQRED